ncbi:hypothetical protein JCM8097_004934 [Rhodosporidiobolus ruineniae]
MAPPHSRVPSPLPVRLVVAKRQEQAPTPAPSASTAPPVANSSASRFLPSQTSLSSSDDNNGGDGGKPEVWRYAIVVIIAVLGLFLLVRLAFVYRLRKHHRQLYLARQQELANQRARRRSRDPRSGANWSRNNSVDTFDLGTPDGGGAGRGAGEAPPPAYEEAAVPAAAGVARGEEAPHSSRPSLFSRLFSSSRPSASPAPPSSYDLRVFPPSSSSPPTGSTSPSPTSRGSTRPHSTSFAEAEAVRRALADAGLLVIPPSLALRHSALNPSSALVSATAEADEDTLRRRRQREERREQRRQRRRDRREREREEQEGAGLPTYSKRKAEGEEVLQRGEGWKDSDEDTDSGSEDEGAPVVEAGGAVVPALTGAPAAREVDEDAQA